MIPPAFMAKQTHERDRLYTLQGQILADLTLSYLRQQQLLIIFPLIFFLKKSLAPVALLCYTGVAGTPGKPITNTLTHNNNMNIYQAILEYAQGNFPDFYQKIISGTDAVKKIYLTSVVQNYAVSFPAFKEYFAIPDHKTKTIYAWVKKNSGEFFEPQNEPESHHWAITRFISCNRMHWDNNTLWLNIVNYSDIVSWTKAVREYSRHNKEFREQHLGVQDEVARLVTVKLWLDKDKNLEKLNKTLK